MIFFTFYKYFLDESVPENRYGMLMGIIDGFIFWSTLIIIVSYFSPEARTFFESAFFGY